MAARCYTGDLIMQEIMAKLVGYCEIVTVSIGMRRNFDFKKSIRRYNKRAISFIFFVPEIYRFDLPSNSLNYSFYIGGFTVIQRCGYAFRNRLNRPSTVF